MTTRRRPAREAVDHPDSVESQLAVEVLGPVVVDGPQEGELVTERLGATNGVRDRCPRQAGAPVRLQRRNRADDGDTAVVAVQLAKGANLALDDSREEAHLTGRGEPARNDELLANQLLVAAGAIEQVTLSRGLELVDRDFSHEARVAGAIGPTVLSHQYDALGLPALELLKAEREPGADLLVVGDHSPKGEPALQLLGFARDPLGLRLEPLKREAIGHRLDPEQVHVQDRRQLAVRERRHPTGKRLPPFADRFVERPQELNYAQALVLAHLSPPISSASAPNAPSRRSPSLESSSLAAKVMEIFTRIAYFSRKSARSEPGPARSPRVSPEGAFRKAGAGRDSARATRVVA